MIKSMQVRWQRLVVIRALLLPHRIVVLDDLIVLIFMSMTVKMCLGKLGKIRSNNMVKIKVVE